MTPETLLAALRAHGIETDNVRDGAHEAAHALDWDVETPWTRENISDGAPRGNGRKFQAELVARAVEQIVCEAVGAPCESLKNRACIAAMEAMKYDRYSAPLDAWIKGIENALKSEEAKTLAAKVLALAETP